MPRPKPKAKAKAAARKKPAPKPTKRATRPKRPAATSKATPNNKLIRWVDLLACLLGHNQPLPLEELKEKVPGYMKTRTLAALRRAFERDKDELREFGIPIVTEKDSSGETRGYRLRREHFYLPYLSLLQDGKLRKPKPVDRYGYKTLASLTFEADELEAVAEAAVRVRRLGVPALDELAASAMRKLAFDLPLDVSTVREPESAYERLGSPALAQSDLAIEAAGASVPPADMSRVLRAPVRHPLDVRVREHPLPDMFEVLERALSLRKRVTITYHTMGTGRTGARDVQPYGLFFLGHNWYLAATDAGSDAPVKNFRLSRISSAVMNEQKPGTADYVVPESFDLPSHARSREAWELGDTATVEAVVRFTGESGPTVAARRLGEPVDGDARTRCFHVRRLETFARWVLSFAGEAEPVSPPELVEAYDGLAEATLALYAEA